jgi:hypothetical protein
MSVALRSGTHVALGFASFAEYVERLFGYSLRSTCERLRVAQALEQLPEMNQKLQDGSLSWSAAPLLGASSGRAWRTAHHRR